MEIGWIGGLSQGLAISALMRNGYEKEANKVLKALKKYCSNDVIYEYPNIEILNGWIYAIFGIYDAKDDKFFKENIEKLKKRLPFYDLGYWSRYDAYSMYPSTLFYHKIHVEQLDALYKLTDDKFFQDLVFAWKFQLDRTYDGYIAKFKRTRMIIKKHGLRGTYRRYKERKRWLRRN